MSKKSRSKQQSVNVRVKHMSTTISILNRKEEIKFFKYKLFRDLQFTIFSEKAFTRVKCKGFWKIHVIEFIGNHGEYKSSYIKVPYTTNDVPVPVSNRQRYFIVL